MQGCGQALQKRINATHPIGISARSKPPNFSSIFSKAGQWGTSSSFSPSFTERYPVSPANQTLAPLSVGDPDKIGKICSTAHDAQSDLKRSNNPRPVTCCPGVQVRRHSPVTTPSSEKHLAG